MFQLWQRVEQGPMTESKCAEAGGGYFSFEVEPVPTAEKPEAGWLPRGLLKKLLKFGNHIQVRH